MLEKFAELEKVQKKVSRGFAQMGISVHTLQQKIALLKAERDLLPIGSLSAIRKYNSEINKLEHSVSKLQTLNGSKLKTWFSEALNSLPGLATNPLILAGAGIGMSIRKGMEADLQQANITTLLRGDVEKALSRPKNGLHLFCQFNLCFSFFKLSIVYKNTFTTSV